MAADSKRFKLGDHVACFTAHGWLEGTVVQLDFDGDKDSGRVPYLVELDASGQEVLAPKDIPELIVAAGKQPAEPWHLKQARELRERGFEYAKEAKHKALFDPSQLSRWFLPGFLRAIGAWRASGDVKMLKLNQLPGIKVETTGVISFQCLTLEFCNLLVEEILNYQAGGFPQRSPNSMNNYGLVLNEIGLKPVFSAMLQDYLQGIAARLFGPEDMRDSSLPAKDLGGENWGGDSLSAHHTFVVRYQPDEDQSLDMHVDECDVTFNFALTPADSFEGNDLAFCGMLGSVSHRKHLHTYKHQQGRCVMHLGKRRHGALPISSGRRMSLIMWCKSPLFRQSDEYLLRRFAPMKKRPHSPDRICLSHSHDSDYEDQMDKLSDPKSRKKTGKTAVTAARVGEGMAE